MDVILIETAAFDELFRRLEHSLIDKMCGPQGLGLKVKQDIKPPDKNDIYISEKEVMSLLGIKNRGYFHRMVSQKNIPHSRQSKKVFIYVRSEIEEYIAKKSTTRLMVHSIGSGKHRR